MSPTTVSTKLAQIANKSEPRRVLTGSKSHVALWSRYPQGHPSECGRVLTNRMSELLTYGSVGGAGRKPGPYPAAPRILGIGAGGSAQVLITWTAVSNGVYRVQAKAELSQTNWIDLPGDVAATSDTASKSDPRGAAQRFYRVQVLP